MSAQRLQVRQEDVSDTLTSEVTEGGENREEYREAGGILLIQQRELIAEGREEVMGEVVHWRATSEWREKVEHTRIPVLVSKPYDNSMQKFSLYGTSKRI